MSEMEVKSMEKREENLLLKLQQEPVRIPNSLLPQNVKKRLEALPDTEKENRRKSTIWHRLAFSGCCIAAAALFLCLLVLNGAFVENNTPQIEAVRNSITTSPYSAAGTMKNYITAYKKLKKYQNQNLAFAESREEMASSSYGIANSGAAKIRGTFESSLDGIINSSDTNANYSDTNVRTEGIDEADVVKTDGSFIYTCDKENHMLKIYHVSGEKVTKVSSISLKEETKSGWLEDMYLSGDRLTVICTLYSPKQKRIKKLYKNEGQSYENYNKASWGYDGFRCAHYESESVCVKSSAEPGYLVRYTTTYVYDISNRKEPALLHTFFQDGSYSGSRMAKGILYLFSQREFNTENLDYNDLTSYIPQIGGECVAAPDVTVSKKSSVNQYTCIAAIQPESCKYLSKNSVLGGTDRLYVSTENIYLMDYNENTSIIKLSFKKGVVEKIAEGSVKGRVLNDYSLDEKNGYLRLVTTYNKKNGKNYNGLFILNEKLKPTGELTDLAENESIYSARFIDDTAYFVTYENTDPLFAADISNPSEPKLLGQLKIPGFSDYLHPYGEHYLLGIGEETDKDGAFIGLKLSMFDIADPTKLKEVHKLVLPEKLSDAEVTNNPNALFIDTEKNLFGFSAGNYKDNQTCYMVFSYDEEKGFTTKLNTSFSESFIPCRGLYIADKFYVVGVGKGIKVFDLESFKKLSQ